MYHVYITVSTAVFQALSIDGYLSISEEAFLFQVQILLGHLVDTAPAYYKDIATCKPSFLLVNIILILGLGILLGFI